MATGILPPASLQGSKTIEPHIDVDGLVKSGQFFSSEALRNIRLRMSTQLQTTLDIDQLVNILYDEIRQAIEINGIHFRIDDPMIRCTIGGIKKHKITYRLTTGKKNYGEITFSKNRRFSEEELFTLESLMDLFIYPLRNALQYQQALNSALTDPLTGAGNRMSLNQNLVREIDLSRRHNQDLCIMMIDIDNFKNINDNYGHATGDRVLNAVAQDIQHTIRCSDALFRFGGEEFVVMLPQTCIDSTQIIAERIRAVISANVSIQDYDRRVTVCIGAANYEKDMNMDELLNKADQAMYIAKRSGKNRVIIANTTEKRAQA